MLSLSSTMRVFVARAPADMRRGFDGLSSMVIDHIQEDPQSGHLFVFLNKRRDRVKILVWCRSGYWLHYHRLEHGRFKIFDRLSDASSHFELQAHELTLLLEGIDLRGSRRRVSIEDIHHKQA